MAELPPHDADAEAALLSCAALDPGLVMPELDRLGCSVAHYHDIRHQLLYKAMQEQWQDRAAIDLIALRTALKDAGKLEHAGGDAYLAEWPGKAPSAHSWQSYWPILKDKHYRRSVLATARKLAESAADPASNMEEVAASVETEVLGMRQVEGVQPGDRKASLHRIIDNLEQAIQGGGRLLGPATGFTDLDRWLNGLRPKALYVLGARPSIGKTQWALNVAENVATAGMPVGFLSLEMSEDELNMRSLARFSGVDVQAGLRGVLGERDIAKLTGTMPKLHKLPLRIRELEGVTIAQLRSEARRLVRREGCGLIVVDYLQLIRGSREYRGNRAAELTEVSNGLKGMAKELNVPVLALAQVSRELEKEKRLPRLSDLRECGAIEQDADAVMFLHCEVDDQDELPVTLLLDKNRTGPRWKKVELVFEKHLNRFKEAPRLAP